MSVENQIILDEFIPSRSNIFDADSPATTMAEKTQRLDNAFNVDLNFEREKKALATGIAIGIPTILALANPEIVHARGNANNILAINTNDNLAGWAGLGLCVAEELVEGTNIKKVPQIALKAAAGWVLGKSFVHNYNYFQDYLSNPGLLIQSPHGDYLAQLFIGTYTMAKTTSLTEFRQGLANTFSSVINLFAKGKDKIVSTRIRQDSAREEEHAWKLYRAPNISKQAEGEQRLINLGIDLRNRR